MSMAPSTSELRRPRWPWLGLLLLAFGSAAEGAPGESGLLFYLSGTRGTQVDFSRAGTREPNVAHGVSRIADGARGPGLQCESSQVLSYWAPGNIYAQRGTLAFFWRAREPVGPTEFPIFRVAFADHSSWDMVWLRIDYNGHGFDAFVTDANLSRIRVSVPLAPFPRPDAWVHLALAWDETLGIRFYVDGKLAATRKLQALLDTGLDQFGPHSRIISPHNVQSDYSFVRGGDLDELTIYDRMLDDAAVAALARGERPGKVPPAPVRSLAEPRFREEWWWRYGWNRPSDPPPYFAGPAIAVRKVEIHDAYDLERWWWKANDGIRETTWPGVYNRSNLPGRRDYFILPDWDCYSVSGRQITFTMPDEPWNYLAIEGAAYGKMSLVDGAPRGGSAAREAFLFERSRGQERTFHLIEQPIVGGKIRFDSAEPEQPIAELSALRVTSGQPPSDARTMTYRLANPGARGRDLAPLVDYIDKRFPPDERALLVAEPAAARGAGQRLPPAKSPRRPSLPIVHVIVPRLAAAPGYDWEKAGGDLDGILLELPALDVKPTHAGLFPMNVQVKDPLWPMRNLLDFTFSVRPGEAKELWLDLRDRILPPGKSLYLTIAGAGGDLGASSLLGARLELVFKARAQAQKEHEIDRFTQLRDAYAMLVEEHPADARFNLWNRFKGDLDDLLRVNPEHELGRLYAAAAIPDAAKPRFVQATPPPGVPTWAFRQVTALERVKRVVLWYIDHRQIENGELGGGLSDDTDLTNVWPGVALMGCQPDKVARSLRRVLDACDANGMIEHGLPAIQTDQLHSYEEGINAIAQNLLLDYGSPRLLERAMETTRGVSGLTAVNAARHRHFRTAYFSASRVAEDSVWGYDKAYMTLLLHPGMLLVNYNGNPAARQLVLELADGLLAHRHRDEIGHYVLPPAIHFASDRDARESRSYFPWPLFWAAYQWSGDRKYLEPIFDGGTASIRAVGADLLDQLGVREPWRARFLATDVVTPPGENRPPGDVRGRRRSDQQRSSRSEHFAWQLTGDKRYLEKLYGDEIEWMARLEYINTEGSIWIDRVIVPHADLQRARLGGVALVRNGTFPGHLIGWRFDEPASEKSVAVLVPFATPTAFDVIAYNLETTPVRATMTAWNVDPGRWEVVRGVDTDDDDRPDRDRTDFSIDLERGSSLPLVLPPRASTVLRFKLKAPAAPYWSRPDLGIEGADLSFEPGKLRVRVHSLGSVDAPPSSVVFRDASNRVRASARIPAIPAPLDLLPKSVEVVLALEAGVVPAGGTVELDPEHAITQITRRNDAVKIPPAQRPTSR